MKSQKKICDDLWATCIKMRAKGKSELSGKPGPLHAHHIAKKGNHRLRYELDNGIAVTPGEHHFGIHGAESEKYRDLIIAKIGQAKFDWLKSLRNGCQKTDLKAIEIYLKQKLAKIQGEENA